jgi:hypothetical protein
MDDQLDMCNPGNSFRSRQVLITKGQQTLGVALPWAIAATLVRPAEKVISISGVGGKSPDDIVPVLKRAPTTPGPVIVGVHVE